ncbi:MAG: hypothetical protein DRJ03_00540 [Chloroflexi bacterium]|nr:MAG: hypothetical protein DRJ03_00540 [Chloroflexota bacterium]
MNLEQAKAKVADISRSTATKHPKVLVSELCGVVQFLLNEIERIQSPPVTILPKRLPEDLELDADRPEPFELPPISPPPTGQPKFPSPNPSVLPSRRREGNAGDAE